MPILVGHSVSLELSSGRPLFSRLHFSLEPKLNALVGPNGVGKTTFARLLAEEIPPSAGSIHRHGSVTYFPQRLTAPEIPVAEYLAEYSWSALGETLLSGIPWDQPCATLSGGQWMRVRLAWALGAGFLVLDEPTNDLDREGRAALLAFLRGHAGGALLISHDRECLAECVEIWELSNHGLAVYGGGWAAYEAEKGNERGRREGALERAKRARDQAARERHEKLARQAKRSRRGAKEAARGGIPRIVAGGLKRRAESTSGRLDAATMEKAHAAVREAGEAFLALKKNPVMYAGLVGAPLPAQKLVAEARGFNVKRGEWIFPGNLTFGWRGNVRVAIRGRNGAGKSTLLRAILGEEFEHRGTLRRGGLATLYVDQRAALLDDAKSVFENVRAVSEKSESEIRGDLARLLFFGEAVFQRVETLRGGERLRTALARGLLGQEKPELLVLDEPTNNLDLANIGFLEGLVREFSGALLIVSHDEVFLENCGVTETLSLGAKRP